MINIKKIIFLICLFAFILFNSFCVFAEWDDETVIDIDKLYSTSARYKKDLSFDKIISLGLDPEANPQMLYKPVPKQDYIDSNFRGVTDDYNAKNKIYRYYPWVIGQRIEGYGSEWARGKSEGLGYIDKNRVASEYPILYLHKVTKNLINANTRYTKWFGNELADVIGLKNPYIPKMVELTDIPDILCKDFFLVYNFVPHVLGTEGSSQYLKQGYVLNTDSSTGIQCILNGTEVLEESKGSTGLSAYFTYPKISGNEVITVKEHIGLRPDLERAIVAMENPMLISNIELAFDEYLHQRNARLNGLFFMP